MAAMSLDEALSMITGTRSEWRSRTRADSMTRCSNGTSRLCLKFVRGAMMVVAGYER